MKPKLYELPISLLKIVKEYKASREKQKSADKAARDAKAMADEQQKQLLTHFGTAIIAKCGNFILSLKTTEAVAASFTLKDGRTVYFRDCQEFTYKDPVTKTVLTFKPKDIAKFYGGRSASDKIEVTNYTD